MDAADIKTLTDLYVNVRDCRIWLTTNEEISDGSLSDECLQSNSVTNFELKMTNQNDLPNQSHT